MDIISRKDAKLAGFKQYFTGKQCKHGHTSPRWVSTLVCCECTAKNAKNWRQGNTKHMRSYRNAYRNDNIEQERARSRKYYLENKDELKQRKKEDYYSNPAKYMLYRASDRAKRLSLPFDLDITDIVIPINCPVLNKPFIVGDYDYAPSIDRIIPSKGYVKGNVVVVSTKANRIKNDATVDEIQQVFEFYNTICC